jgi:serine/threonine protein kinase
MTQMSPAEAVFFAALDRKPEERAAYLDQACAGDADLRARVERLLAAHPNVGGFLEPASTDAHEPAAPTEGVGAVVAGKYKLVEAIGEGGMGSVFMAQQTEPVKRTVAVKVIKAGMDSRAVLARFDAERQAFAMMDHPNIARVLDAGATGSGRPFFVMELVKGVPITRFCDERRLTPRQRLELFVPVCQAIQHAHQKGVIHRDIKPSNVLVAMYDDKAVPKVIDFGVAKATGPQLTDHTLVTGFGAVVGTPEYMSPEQASFNQMDIDTRSDVYALGVLLYELLTGTTPVDRKSLGQAALLEILRIVREVEPQRPSTKLSSSDALPGIAANRNVEPARLARLMRGELDWIVMRALEKDRARRYDTANGLARDVQRYLADEPVEARPPSAGYRLGKLLKRNRGPVAAAGLVLLALVAGIAGTTFGLVRAEQRRHDAEEARALAEAREREARAEKENALNAAAAEKTAKEQTKRRLDQIEKGVDLLASLLAGINPRNEAKGGPTLYEQLRDRAGQAADELDAEAVGDALAVARLQTVLGETLRELGDFPKAIAVLEKARATRERELGEDHPDALASRNGLAGAYRAAGRLDLAVPLFERTLKACEAKLGDDHPNTLASRNNLALAYRDVGRLDLAVPLYERTLKAREDKLGDDHPDTLTSRNNLALVYKAAGRLDLAVPLYERTLNACEARLGDDHPDTLASRNNLASAYRDVGKPTLAVPLLERTLKAREAKLGDDHPDTLASRNNLALAYQSAGELARATPLFERTLKACEARLGNDHPDTLTACSNLAGAYRDARRLELAVPLLERTLKARVAGQGDDHPDTLQARNNLASAYRDVGRLGEAVVLFEQAARGAERRHFQLTSARLIVANTIRAYEAAKQLDKAEVWRRKWLEVVRQQAGAASPAYADELAGLGVNLLRQQRWADAEAVLRECLAVREAGRPDAWATFNTRSVLGDALLGQGKHAEAEPLLLAGYEGMKRREGTIPAGSKDRLASAADRLVRLYEATGRPDDAAKWRKELYAAAEPVPAPRAVIE